MKKLSIEEKVYDGNYKSYTELINRLEDVKDAIKKQNYGIAMDILCKPYPEYQIITSTEFKESEGEKMRKIISDILLIDSDEIREILDANNVLMQDIDAWLEKQGRLMKALQISNARIGELIEKNYYLKEQFEKQGDKTEPIDGFNTEFEKQVSCLIASAINREHEYNQGYVKWTANALLNYAKHELEKQGKNSMGISEATKQKLEDNLNKALEKETPESFNEFLDEQGEQKHAIFIPKFRVGDEIKTANEEPLTITKIDEKGYWSEDLFICGFDEECIWYCVEQKPTYKVEPKFHVGDWVVFKDKHESIYQVEKIEGGYYILRHTYGGTFRVCVLHDEDLRLWTINDAKDGDILATDSWLYMFKYTNNKALIQFHCKCPINGKTYKWSFLSDDSYLDIYIDANIHPATKEQHDILFQKMKEAGYEWDVEKKELKKIEEEEYNGEDYGIDSLYHAQRILEKTLGKVDGYQSDDGILEHKCAITAIKELYEQKPAWSEEDENNILFLTSIIEECFKDKEKITLCGDTVCANFTKEDIINRLKSLKDRHTWKPSDEQIYALRSVVTELKHGDNKYQETIEDLYNDLEKLRGE